MWTLMNVHSWNNHKAFFWMSPGNKDIVRNSSCNSLRAAPWRLAEQLRSDTLELLQIHEQQLQWSFWRQGKQHCFFSQVPNRWFIPSTYVPNCQLPTNSIELAFRMYLAISELPDLELHSYGGKQKKCSYLLLFGSLSFWEAEFLCHRGSFSYGVLFNPNC